LDGPYGVFTTERYWESAGFVLIAGGVGITPIYSMLLTAAERKDDRPFLLIYSAPSWEEVT
jgi:3-phenylpropionate/trans-cinnamate dioxygenase ferredoxin reductase subunit